MQTKSYDISYSSKNEEEFHNFLVGSATVLKRFSKQVRTTHRAITPAMKQ
jgi:hypothetical protein